MECRGCSRTLDGDARFCPGCGMAVEATCASCGAPLDADARFCKRCGEPVAAPTSRAQGPQRAEPPARERKIATLLFADVVGFTELTERHDAEVVSRLIGSNFDRLAAEVDRYGGTVEKFAGDALLAVFGVPATHEDDPERAVRAALEMQSLMHTAPADDGSIRLRLRIGIETGEVLADLARSAGERDLFVTGDAVNTAARLQSAADPGAIVVGPTTYAGTRGLVEYEELPAQALKGKALPVASWKAVRVRSRRGGIRPPLGIEAPLIGRDEELALLKETIRRTVTAGRPHLVTILGEAGVGKTRLIWELEKYLDGLPEAFHWRKGRCYSYASVSYAPLVEAVKADAKITDDDPPSAVSAKLDARVTELATNGEELPVRTALQMLMGLGGDQALAQDELFEAWRLHLAAVAARHPLVLVVEDIHWADEAMLDFIEFIARWGDAPITIVCVARPELLERREAWGGGIRNASLVELAALEAEESVAMVDGLLGGALPRDVRDRVVAMANGNPLFTEELVRMFVDQGALQLRDGVWRLVGSVDELSVPSTVQAVLSARLDELTVEEKRIAQEASVVGRIFWDVIVSHLRGRHTADVAALLQGLRVKELVAPRTPSTLAGAGEWAFHHVLVRDVAYDSLPKADRGTLHLQVARWAEQELADRIDEFAELVASHVLAALRYEEELRGSGGGDEAIVALREKALSTATRAARRAGSVQDRQSARRWQLLAIEQARRLGRPEIERARLAEEFFRLTGHQLDAAERVSVFREATALLEPVAERPAEERELWGRLRSHLGQALHADSQTEEAKAVLLQTAGELRVGSPSAARAKALQTLSAVLWKTFELQSAQEVAATAVDEARASGAADVHRWALHEEGVIRGLQGDASGGLEYLRQSYDLAVEADDRELLLRCCTNIPSTQLNSGYPLTEADELLTRGVNLARRSAAYGSLAFLLENKTELSWLRGEFADMIEQSEEQIDAATRAGTAGILTCALAYEADACWALGRREEALEWLERVASRSKAERGHLDQLLVTQSRLELERDPEGALARLTRHRAEFEGYPNAELNVALWLARMAYRVGDERALEEATATQERHAEVGGPLRRLEHDWTVALRADDEAGLTKLSADFAAYEYRLYAAEVLVDAALAAARRGDDVAALERARSAVAELDYRPLLGSLPESRWVGVGMVAT